MIPSSEWFHAEFVAVGRVVGRRIGRAELVLDANAEPVVAVRIQVADVTVTTSDTRTDADQVTVGTLAHFNLNIIFL